MNRRSKTALSAALLLTLPWVGLRVAGEASGIDATFTVILSGLAVLGTSFLLAWAAETAEKDVPRAFAIAVLAVLAVAPEYAVDALYAWEAGQFAGMERGVEAGNLAVANMTGANRILIGIGWSGIALFTILRARSGGDAAVVRKPGFLRDAIQLDAAISLEIVFLFLATLWAFLVPIGGGIGILDMVVLVGLYVAYISVVLRGGTPSEAEPHGVPRYLQSFPRKQRIAIVLGLFLYAGVLLLVAVKPFAHGLETLGTAAGVPPFFMIQWIAPLASESPELIVVAYLVTKARSTAGFNALISSKLNQWTLLIGTLVIVYSIGLGRYGALTFDTKQAGEIWLTAAQSFFALALLVDFEFTIREALVLAALFLSQVFIEYALVGHVLDLPISSYQVLLAYAGLYVVCGTWLLVSQLDSLRDLAAETTDIAIESGREAIETQ